MTKYATMNPLGSTSPYDFFDNSQNFDTAINSITAAIWQDRLGRERHTWHGLEKMAKAAIAAFGYITLDSFQAGATLIRPNEVLRDITTGEYYRWDGSFLPSGKVVPAGSSPASSGGIGPGAWLSVGDAVLRANLASPDGAKLVGILLDGGLPTSVAEILKYRISAYAFNGVRPDTGDDVTALLQAAADAAYAADVELVLEGGVYYVPGGVTFRRPLICNGYVTFVGEGSGDVPPSTNIYFSRQHNNQFISYTRCVVNFSTGIPGEVSNAAIAASIGGVFLNSRLVIGTVDGPTSYASIKFPRFRWELSRSHPLIQIVNVSNVEIDDAIASEGRIGVEVVATRGYATDNIRVTNCDFSTCVSPISMKGSSNKRITNVLIEKCKLIGSTRDSSSHDTAGVNIWWGINVILKDNDIQHMSDCVKLYACLNVNISGGHIKAMANYPCIRLVGCKKVKISSNLDNKYGGYGVLATAANALPPPGATGNMFTSSDITVENSRLYSADRAIKLEATNKGRVINNEFMAGSINSATSLLWFASGSTDCREWGNTFKANSGTPILNNIGSQLTSGLPDGQLEVVSVPASPVISTPVITAADPALNMAKSYVVSFTVGDATQIKADASNTKKTLSQWMEGKTATVGINAGAFNPTTGNLPDCAINGALIDSFGGEDYWFARSAAVIDYHNTLSCRDFGTPIPNATVSLSIGAKQMTEDAWQSILFRAPLIVDGAVYDPVSTFLISKDGWDTQISARTCIGQKADKTYVILVVDGTTNVSGCTMKQAAQKLLTLGCINAFNCDGGGSSTLWYNGAVINSPSDAGEERAIPHVIYI